MLWKPNSQPLERINLSILPILETLRVKCLISCRNIIWTLQSKSSLLSKLVSVQELSTLLNLTGVHRLLRTLSAREIFKSIWTYCIRRRDTELIFSRSTIISARVSSTRSTGHQFQHPLGLAISRVLLIRGVYKGTWVTKKGVNICKTVRTWINWMMKSRWTRSTSPLIRSSHRSKR